MFANANYKVVNFMAPPMHVPAALGVEAAQGEASSWMWSCVKQSRGWELAEPNSFSRPPFKDVARVCAAVLIHECC